MEGEYPQANDPFAHSSHFPPEAKREVLEKALSLFEQNGERMLVSTNHGRNSMEVTLAFPRPAVVDELEEFSLISRLVSDVSV